MSVKIIDVIVREATSFLSPVVGAAGDRELLEGLLTAYGAPPELAADAGLAVALQSLAQLRDEIAVLGQQPIASLAGLRALLHAVEAATAAVNALGAGHGPALESLGSDLASGLAVVWLQTDHPTLFAIADLLGFVRTGDDALIVPPVHANGEILRFGYAFNRFRPEALGELVNDVPGALKALYAPGGLITNAAADETAAKIFPRLGLLLQSLGATWTYGLLSEHQTLLGDAAPLVEHAGIAYVPDVVAPGIDAGVVLTLSSRERGELGLVCVPFGALNLTHAIGRWHLAIAATAEVDALAIGPHGVTMTAPPGVDSASASVRVSRGGELDDGLAFVLGTPSSTRLEIGGLAVAVDLTVEAGSHTFAISTALSSCALVVAPGDGDSFLGAFLPDGGVRARFDLALAWSNRRGVSINGNLGTELLIPTSINLGALALDAMTLRLTAATDRLHFEASAAARIKLGPVSVIVDGLGLRGEVAVPDKGGSLGGAAFDLDFRAPTTLGVAVRTAMVNGAGLLSADDGGRGYSGALALEAGGLLLTAVGVLETPAAGAYSLAAVVTSQFPSIPLPFGFTLDGVGGFVGINRRVDLEALRAAIRGPGMTDIFFASDPIRQIERLATDLRLYFPENDGRHVFGPAFKLGWGRPTIVRATLAVLLEVPAPVRLALLGRVSAQLPTVENPIINLVCDVVGEIDFADKRVAIDASLSPESSVAGFPITGDAAIRMRWADPPSFALSVGGFHSQFPRPAGFPELRRILIPVGSGDDPRLDVTGFLALTSNTAQIGADVSLYASAGPLNIQGTLGFEALLTFSPFALRAGLWAGVTLRRGQRVLAGIHFDGHISGPWPWRVDGKATLSLWLVDLSVSVHVTLGPGEPPTLASQAIWPLLEAALEEREAWSTERPRGRPSVTTAPPESAAAPRIDPGGSLSFRQKVVPLDRRIVRFGHAVPTGVDVFRVTELRVGTAVVPFERITDWFAPAQFDDLSEADKLSRPGFERMPAGATAGSVSRSGPSLTKILEYETILWADDRRQVGAPHRPTHDEQIIGIALGAVAQSPGFSPPPPPPRFVLAEETYVIASAIDLQPRLDLIGHVTRGDAELKLREHLDGAPLDAAHLLVIPSHELAA